MRFIRETISFAFLLISIVGICQDSSYYHYNQIIDLARKESQLDHNTRAEMYYDSAFKIIDFVPYNYFYAFSAAISDSNFTKANDYLIQGAKKGMVYSDYSSNLTKIFNKSSFYGNFQKIKDSLENLYMKSIDKEYYDTLVKLKNIDQANRNGGTQCIKNDGIIFDKLVSLSLSHGFPTYKLTGYGCNIAILILWHHSHEYPGSEQWKKIIPLINEQINKGLFDPNFFLTFEKKLKEGH